MKNIDREQIARSLFTGVLLALFVFMETVTGNLILEVEKSHSIFYRY